MPRLPDAPERKHAVLVELTGNSSDALAMLALLRRTAAYVDADPPIPSAVAREVQVRAIVVP